MLLLKVVLTNISVNSIEMNLFWNQNWKDKQGVKFNPNEYIMK